MSTCPHIQVFLDRWSKATDGETFQAFSTLKEKLAQSKRPNRETERRWKFADFTVRVIAPHILDKLELPEEAQQLREMPEVCLMNSRATLRGLQEIQDRHRVKGLSPAFWWKASGVQAICDVAKHSVEFAPSSSANSAAFAASALDVVSLSRARKNAYCELTPQAVKLIKGML